MNIPLVLFVALCITLTPFVTHVAGGNQDYSNSANVESVTTFYDCSAVSNATIPQDQKASVCDPGDATKPITVVRFIARPGENDVDAGRAMYFWTFPQPFTNMPVNQQNGDPPDNPCAQSNSFTNCSAFTDGNDTTGPIKVQVTVAKVVRKYFLKQVLDKLTVPYSYVNYNAKVPKCVNPAYCQNGCEFSDDETCDPGDKTKTQTSFYACCQIQDDYVALPCKKNRYYGNILQQANGLYDYGDDCGDSDSTLIYNFDGSYGNIGSETASCRSCSKIYGVLTKEKVANWGAYNNTDSNANSRSHARGCPDPLYLPRQDQEYPRLMPDICPVAVSHAYAYPVTEGNRNSMNHGNPDAYAMEPYYYWCQSMCVGSNSYSFKSVEVNNEDKLTATCGDTATDGTVSNDGRNIGNLGRGSLGVRIQDHMMHWQEAYQCSLQGDKCKALTWAKSLDQKGYPCCNSTTSSGYGDIFNSCGTVQNASDPLSDCGGMAAEQVRNAASYYVQSCDANESGELAQCGTTCQVDDNHEANDLSWSCPGWPYDYIRPGVIGSPMTTADQKPGLAVAKCSGECQADPFIRWAETGNSDKDCSGNSCTTSLQSITSQKAAIGMGGASCRVYQVVPEPIIEVSMLITYTGPDGVVVESTLATDSSTTSQKTATVQDTLFTTRINEIFVDGGVGPQIPGYIVQCGTDEEVRNQAEWCQTDNIPHYGTISSYNPYDGPTQNTDDDDILIPKPENDVFCANGRSGGYLRGKFPVTDPVSGEDISLSSQNPWPQLVRKMVQARTASKTQTAGESGQHLNDYADEGLACHAPTPRYLGVLNCGKPVYWYYVSPERKTSYGLGCGQVGMQNSFPLGASARRTMCLQEDNSCTPGYGLPKFTSSNAPFFRTPCQELGDMIKSTIINYDLENGKTTAVKCDIGHVPLGLQIPGFEYIPSDYQATQADSGYVPNTWVDGTFLYQEMTSSEQQNIKFDMSMYTDTFFGGNLQSYAPGTLTDNADETNICVAVANDLTGILSVIVGNPTTNAPGSYSVTAVCTNPATGDALDPQNINEDGVATAGSATVTGIDLPPKGNQTVSWNIYAVGVAPAPPGTDLDTDMGGTDTDPGDQIGVFPNCIVTLNHGGGDNAELAKLDISCSVYALQILKNDKITVLEDAIVFRESCADWILITRPFCWLSNQGPYLTAMIIFLLVVSFVLMGYLSFKLTEMYTVQLQMGPFLEKFKQEEAMHEQFKQNKATVQEAQLVKKILSSELGNAQRISNQASALPSGR